MTPRPQSSAPVYAETSAFDARRHQRRVNRLGVLTAAFAVVLAAALPAASRMLNLIKVADFPLGFYVSAQAALVLLAALLVAFAARVRRIARQTQGSGFGFDAGDDYS